MNSKVLVVGTQGGEKIDWVKNVFEKISFFGCSFLDNLIEGNSVKSVHLSRSFAGDTCSSWSIVHEGKFSKSLSMFIAFQVGLVSFNNLWAVILSTLNNEKFISIFSLFDHSLTALEFFFWHGLDESFFIFPVEILEKDGVSDERFDQELSFCAFWNFSKDNGLLFIEGSKSLLRNTHSALRFPLKLFLLNFSFKFSNSFFIFRIWFFFGGMFFSISFKPVDGKVDGVCGSLLDNVVDKWLNEDVYLWGDVLLYLKFLLFHCNYRKWGHLIVFYIRKMSEKNKIWLFPVIGKNKNSFYSSFGTEKTFSFQKIQ